MDTRIAGYEELPGDGGVQPVRHPMLGPAALVHQRVVRAGSMSSQGRSAAVSGRLIGALWRDEEVDDPASGVGPPLLEVLVQSGDLVVA